MRTIDVHELQQLLADGKIMLLDVRGDDEFSYAAIAGSVHIPLPELPRRADELNPARPIAVLCHHGLRSEMAARWLERNGFTDVSNVAGGIDAWSMHVDPTVPRY
jgi:rhodanese-related sulfurtransferase